MDVKFDDLNQDFKDFLNLTKQRCIEEDTSFRGKDLRHEKYSSIDRDLKLSRKGLNQCMKWVKESVFELNVNGELYGSQHRLQFNFSQKELKKVANLMKEQFGYKWKPSGVFKIPEEGGFFGWHHNANKPFPRVYFVWAKEENSSWFYIQKKGKIITTNEPKGWSINMFQPPYWHSGKSDCMRISIGFRQLEGEAIWRDQEK